MYPFSFLGGGSRAAITIVKDFRDRVEADGGTFEAYSCMVAQINELLAPVSYTHLTLPTKRIV